MACSARSGGWAAAGGSAIGQAAHPPAELLASGSLFHTPCAVHREQYPAGEQCLSQRTWSVLRDGSLAPATATCGFHLTLLHVDRRD